MDFIFASSSDLELLYLKSQIEDFLKKCDSEVADRLRDKISEYRKNPTTANLNEIKYELVGSREVPPCIIGGTFDLETISLDWDGDASEFWDCVADPDGSPIMPSVRMAGFDNNRIGELNHEGRSYGWGDAVASPRKGRRGNRSQSEQTSAD